MTVHGVRNNNKDYDAALIKAQSLHMDDNYSWDSKNRWDKERKALIKLIEEKKAEEEGRKRNILQDIRNQLFD